MKLIYETVGFHNYGLAIILFTVFIKLVLLPLSIKQTKSSVLMQKLTPQMSDIDRRFKNDKNKAAEEKMKLMKEHKASPMGGCLPMLLQFPILIALYWVISSPLKYMYGKSAEMLAVLKKFIMEVKGFVPGTVQGDISIVNFFNQLDPSSVDATIQEANRYVVDSGVLQAGQTAISSGELINTKFLFGLIDLGRTPTINTGTLLGPDWKIYVPLLLIPILAGLTAWLAGKYSTGKLKKKEKENDPKKPAAGDGGSMQQMSKSMILMMPLMSVFISFTVPAGLGFYWTISNVAAVVQQILVARIVEKEAEANAGLPVIQSKTIDPVDAGKGGKNDGRMGGKNRQNGG